MFRPRLPRGSFLMVALPLSLGASACSGGEEEVERFDETEDDDLLTGPDAPEGPRCGDGQVDPGELCDDRRYCAADCVSVIGSCGDGVLQSFEDCDTGLEDHPGCVDCTLTYSYLCEGQPSVCDQSTLPRELLLVEMTDEQHAVWCSWSLEVYGGPRSYHDCGNGSTWTIISEEQCVANPLDVWGACTVGEVTDWIAGAGHWCWLIERGDPPCTASELGL